MSDDDYCIAVAVGNPDNAEQLVRTARDIASERGGEVFVVGVVVTPRESPFALFTDEVIAREFGGERRAVLDRAVSVAAESDVPVNGKLFVASSVARGVLHGVRERDCDALLLGWEQRTRQDAVLGSNVDRVVRRADCDVLVEKIGAVAGEVEAVLLPVAESRHADFAASVARAIAVKNDATVTLLRVVGSEREESAARELLAAQADSVSGVDSASGDGSPSDVEVENVVREGDVADVIVAASERHDVTVLGATRSGAIRRRVVGSTPQEVGRRADGTIILAKRGDGSLASRVFRL
ncbi:universal stress protein [Halorussus gelatinilyticus]|uniref:Universal stress protein n=1 Tax=Halorussus gelatinilyticus TaxID=2937524 RepID=A0A8U0IM79_9EURY|nr:universal stress protein [Halorussus gelatinilyticus]UPW01721.1 universal stress protein [Halorussus gelatinilyticus]